MLNFMLTSAIYVIVSIFLLYPLILWKPLSTNMLLSEFAYADISSPFWINQYTEDSFYTHKRQPTVVF